MKNSKIVLFIIGVLLTSVICAQNEIRIGLNAGVNATTFNESIIAGDSSPKIGFLIGTSFEYYLNEVLSIKANLNYVRKSHKSEYIFQDDQGGELGFNEQIVKNNDLMLPILLKYDFGKTKNFFLNGGFALSYLINLKIKDDEFSPIYQKISLNETDAYLTIGAGTKFNLDGKNDINIELRYNYNIPNMDVVANYGNIVETNTINIIANWNFRL